MSCTIVQNNIHIYLSHTKNEKFGRTNMEVVLPENSAIASPLAGMFEPWEHKRHSLSSLNKYLFDRFQ